MEQPTNGSYPYPSTSSYGDSGGSSYGYGGGSPPQQQQQQHHNAGGPGSNPHLTTLRRRHVEHRAVAHDGDGGASGKANSMLAVKKLDFMFPKVDQEYTVQTDRGGAASVIAAVMIFILAAAEGGSWWRQNRSTIEHIQVDTALGKRMRVNLNITFPALACEDLHVDVMDVAGDSQLNVEDTMVKKSLDLRGRPLGEEQKVESNAHRQEQEKKAAIQKAKLPEDYCGPCYGAQESDDQCCDTCDELLAAYSKKSWKTNLVQMTSEQCIREGRDKVQPKRMTPGQGCNLSGHMVLNRVAGNFHIAMGEGIERDGRHIHTFVPDDTPNFNASHIIHHLSFGAPHENIDDSEDASPSSSTWTPDETPLNGVTKIVTKRHGTTGLFQYFIKVVPTTYMQHGRGVGGKQKKQKGAAAEAAAPARRETNRYFFTERFRPLMKEYLEEEEMEPDDSNTVAVKAGAAGGDGAGHKAAAGHGNQDHHDVRNAVLPGVFFLYEIYPFHVEVSPNSVPWTHLLIRVLATVGGVLTAVRWADSWLYERDRRNRRRSNYVG